MPGTSGEGSIRKRKFSPEAVTVRDCDSEEEGQITEVSSESEEDVETEVEFNPQRQTAKASKKLKSTIRMPIDNDTENEMEDEDIPEDVPELLSDVDDRTTISRATLQKIDQIHQMMTANRLFEQPITQKKATNKGKGLRFCIPTLDKSTGDDVSDITIYKNAIKPAKVVSKTNKNKEKRVSSSS